MTWSAGPTTIRSIDLLAGLSFGHERLRRRGLAKASCHRRRHGARSSPFAIAAALLGTACGPTVVPMGGALPLPAGAPRNGCELGGFLELRQTEVYSSASDETPTGYGSSIVRSVDTRGAGVGLYRPGADEPEELPEALAPLDDGLYRRHLGRIAPIESKRSTRQAFVVVTLIGAVATLAGAGVALATSSSSSSGSSDGPKTPVLIGLGVAGGGLVVMGIGAIGAIVAKPSVYEQTDYELRKRVLVPAEDDMQAAARAVDGHNQRARSRCGR